MRVLILFLVASLLYLRTAQANMNWFDQMFHAGQEPPPQGEPQNAPSDASSYRMSYDGTPCSNYLCPDTLACVHFPHHCPCAWSPHEDKFELAEGQRICISKGGFEVGETAVKVDLARRGKL